VKKRNVTLEAGRNLLWNDFLHKDPATALPTIYDHADKTSKTARDWYWRSIRNKRLASMVVRTVSFSLAVIGAVGPLLAATKQDAQMKLQLTQLGVAAIAVAGLMQLCDSVFGWSSGWLRYTTTVTAMEKLGLQFQLDWAGYCLGRPALGEEDKRLLFDLAKTFELEIAKRRSEETDGWVAEFNRGMAALNEMIRFQKDATEKAAAQARAQLEAKIQAARKGSIEVTISQNGPSRPVRVFLDDEEKDRVSGSSWVIRDISPGQHKVHMELEDKSFGSSKIASVLPGEVARLEIKLF
jgi:hypothetical protein